MEETFDYNNALRVIALKMKVFLVADTKSINPYKSRTPNIW